MNRLRRWYRAARRALGLDDPPECDNCGSTKNVATFVVRFDEEAGGSAMAARLCPDHAPQEAHA